MVAAGVDLQTPGGARAVGRSHPGREGAGFDATLSVGWGEFGMGLIWEPSQLLSPQGFLPWCLMLQVMLCTTIFYIKMQELCLLTGSVELWSHLGAALEFRDFRERSTGPQANPFLPRNLHEGTSGALSLRYTESFIGN